MVAQIDSAMVRQRPAKIPGRLMAWALIEGRPLTTSGQWINPLVFRLFGLAQRFPRRKGSEAPIYIVGTGRSGTTVLGTLFAMHRDAVFLNEPKAAWHFVQADEDLIGSYSGGPAQVRFDAAEATPAKADRLARIYSWAMRWGRASRVVDKYPELVFRLPYVRALFRQARFVAIVRNGVDACSSVRGWSRRKGEIVAGEVHDWWGRDGRKWHLLVDQIVPLHADLAVLQDRLRSTQDPLDRAAVEWIVSMREVLQQQNDFPEMWVVRYEELCAEPVATLRRIWDHCGLAHDPVAENYAKEILAITDPYSEIALMPELVGPFQEVLSQMSYGDSKARVSARMATS